MNFFVAYLESKRYIALKESWIQNPILGKESKVFFSNDENTVPDFSLPIQFYLNNREDGVYDAFVYRKFGKYFCFFE